MEQKQRFVTLVESRHFTVSELCREFGISRKTGHKSLARYRLHGRAGLEEKSRAPNGLPGKIELEKEGHFLANLGTGVRRSDYVGRSPLPGM